ncbi:phenazine biosynthesis protein PhzF [Amycolatopsis jejuensis]|uniref:phenazine biosynthesis protein PhzF n=1 Tax=Amycolatopsis jejuensis TaxID=330084 RepID=UPI0005262618|nr:phenazine biosynthesis protein PhzF [Amycolatopsis jejuensis]
MRVTRVDMFGTASGRGSTLDVLVPDGPCGSRDGVAADAVAGAAAHAGTTADTIESVLVGECSRAEKTFSSRIFNTGGETPFGMHSLAGTAALLVTRGVLAPGEVGRRSGGECQWLTTDGRTVEVPFTGPVVDHEIPAEPAVFGPYAGSPRSCGVGRAFTFVRVGEDPRALPAPDAARLAVLGLRDLTLFRWDPARREVLARVFAPGFGLPEDPGCLPVAAALGLIARGLVSDDRAPVTIRQVTLEGTESVLHCAGSVRDGTAELRVTSQVRIVGDLVPAGKADPV